MLAWFERLSLRAKLALGFGTLLGLMLIGGTTALLSHAYALRTVEAFLEGDHRIAELSLESSAAMGKARRYEKEFLLKAQVFSHEEARSRYAPLVASQLASVRENMAAIGNPDVTRETLEIAAVTRQYEAGFQRTVELYGRLGRVDTGLEGRLRDRAHVIENLLAQGAPEHLRSGLLTLRRHEKDFIRRGLSRHAEEFEAAAGRFAKDVAQAGLTAGRKQELRQSIEQYRALFREYVTTDAEIDAATLDYLGAVHKIEPQLEQLHAHAGAAVAATRDTIQRLGQTTTLTLLGVGLASILLGLLVSGFIVRQAGGFMTDQGDTLSGANEFPIRYSFAYYGLDAGDFV